MSGGWFGWLRQRKGDRWQRVCEAADLGTCSQKIGRIARQRGIRDRDTVMTQGCYPREAEAPATQTSSEGDEHGAEE